MDFMDKVYAKLEAVHREGLRGVTHGKAVPTKTSSPNRMCLYVASTTPIDGATGEQIQGYGLKLLLADPTFKRIIDQAIKDKVPTLEGRGTAASASGFVNSFDSWLKAQNLSLDDAKSVMGKKLFVQGGEAQNPTDGSKFSWALIGAFF